MTRGSVIVPAHDEASVIRRCLDALFTGIDATEIDVIVACNGCTDDTAELARSSGHPVRVIEIPTPSKPAALRAAEAGDPPFPRIYLDADVELAGPAALAVLTTLDDGAAAARPPIRFDTERSSSPVRAYYRARGRAPALMERLWGAGVYGLSRSGRERFGDYPDVVAEDLFVDQHFDDTDIAIVPTVPVVVRVPRTTDALLRVLRRTYRGNDDNQRDLAPDDTRSPRTSTSVVFRQVAASARLGPGAARDAVVYVAITIAARLRARLGHGERWERDDTSREA